MGLLFSKRVPHFDLVEELRVALIVYDGVFFSKFRKMLVDRNLIAVDDADYIAAFRLWDMGVRTKIIREVRVPDYSGSTERCKWIRRSITS